MATNYTQAYCTFCQRRIRAERPGTNHLLHLLLTLVTGGVWLIVWLLCSIRIGGYRCPMCGGRRLKFRLLGIGPLPKNAS
jgi:hypothetical protein